MTAVIHTTVLLRHDLPDGSHHFDWLLDLAGDDSSPLTTFRLPEPLHELAPGAELSAVRIADHRRAYLDFEGPVSGDRGRVRQAARGVIRSMNRRPQRWDLAIEWAGVVAPVQSVRIEFDVDSSPSETAERPCRVFCVPQAAENT